MTWVMLLDMANTFCETLVHEHARVWTASTCCRDLRMWTVETRFCLQELARTGSLPRNLTHPHDRAIRAAASETCSPHFQDPGNLLLDQIVQILRLWEFMDTGAVAIILKVQAAPYGTSSNNSARGAVNLRGNVIESLLLDLQRMGAGTETTQQHWERRQGASSSSGSWRPSPGFTVQRSCMWVAHCMSQCHAAIKQCVRVGAHIAHWFTFSAGGWR